jgi:thiamine-phosphate pyrophosphorylase
MTRIRCDGKGRLAHSQSAVQGLPCCPTPYSGEGATVRRVHTPGERLATASLYLCTDARRERGDLAEFADAALAGGVDIIQLRDKGSAGEQQFGPLEARQELEALEILADAARRHGALLAVNDRADIAVAAGADVLHLGQDDLPLPIARDIIGPRPVIGRSTHDRAQARAAAAEEVDYFCVGPCWPTPTKPGRPAPGLDLVRATAELASGAASAATSDSGAASAATSDSGAASAATSDSGAAGPTTSGTDKPWFAIGGIDEQRLPEVLAAGARRIVVVRAITGAEDPGAAAQRLKARLAAAE